MAGGKGRGATRHAARERAFEVLYSLCFQEAPDIDALEKAFRSRPDAKTDPAGVPAEGTRQPEESHPDEPLPEPEGFDWELTKGVWKNTAGLDKIIEAHSRHWNMKRIGRIELTILRIAAYEITQTDVHSSMTCLRPFHRRMRTIASHRILCREQKHGRCRFS